MGDEEMENALLRKLVRAQAVIIKELWEHVPPVRRELASVRRAIEFSKNLLEQDERDDLIMLALARRREMPAYIIADATIHDIEKHRAVFLPAVDELIARMGGKILARTSNPNHFGYGGGWQNGRRMILLEFPDADKAKEWHAQLHHLPEPDNMTRHSVILLDGIEN